MPLSSEMLLLHHAGMESGQTREVLPLDPGNYAAAGRLLARAFRADPLWTAILADPGRRPEMLVDMFTALIRTMVKAQGVADKTPDLAGVALWQPPGTDIGLGAMARSGFVMPRFVMRLARPDRKLMTTVLRQVGDRRKALVPKPHWYVAAIGVDPESQGMGVGSALMETGIDRAASAGTAIYLETETPTNVTFYQRLGFEVIEEFTPTGTDVTMWLMAKPGTPGTS